jgi:Set1/Ash2 histone methyltransferase complex subunit ASH2
VKIDVDGCAISNSGGYRSVRAAYGLSEGASYFEVRLPEDHSGGCRLGWSTERGDPEATVGYDEWQYGLRDKDGAVFHNSRGRSFGHCGFAAGDVMGCYIYLAPPSPSEQILPKVDVSKPMPEIVRETEEYWAVRILPEISYALPSSNIIPQPRPGSYMCFFKNGQLLGEGPAFTDLHAGTYYPAVSLYFGHVTAHFGPEFQCPPVLSPTMPPPTPASALVPPPSDN